MTAGLPGIGIGGIFYLLCALLMPVCEFVNTLRGKRDYKRWKVAVKQFMLAGMIVAGFWVTGIALTAAVEPAMKIMAQNPSFIEMDKHNIFRVQNLWFSLILLSGVLVGLRVFNFLWDFRDKT